MRKTSQLALMLALLFAGGSLCMWGQAARVCSLGVQVTDQSGARIPGVIVLKTSRPNAALTDGSGHAQVWLCDEDSLIAQAPGFRTTMVTLSEPLPASVAMSLDVGNTGGGFPVEPVESAKPEPVQVAAGVLGGGQAAVVPPSGTTLALIGPTIQSVLTGDMLGAMPHQTVTVENGHTHAMETYSGVPLASVLEKVGAPTGKDVHGKALSMYVVATGSDGYKAVVALAEAEPDFHPGQVLVADQMAGKPLDVKEGPFKLIVSEDKRPARSVHSLVKLELKQAD